jgi:hypothetical protein
MDFALEVTPGLSGTATDKVSAVSRSRRNATRECALASRVVVPSMQTREFREI